MNLPALRPAALAFLVGVFAASLGAQTPAVIVAFKANGYLQTSATAEDIYDPTYGIDVQFFSPVSTATQMQFRGPVTLTVPRLSSFEYELVRTFSSQAALDAALPDGAYTLAISGGGTATNIPVTVSSTPAIPPVLVTNFDALQAVPDGNLTINWQPVSGGSRSDFILVELMRADGTNVYSSPSLGATGSLDGTATSTTISNVSIAPGETLTGYLSYLRLNLGLVNNGLTGLATGTGFNVTFSVKRQPLTRPVIAYQPQPITVALGSTAVLGVSATGSGLTYQWKKNGAPIAGATGANYVIVNTPATVAGSYSVDVTNSAGTVTSTAATLNVTTTANPGRLINLSILAPLVSGETMTIGTSLGGFGTSGSKPLVVRAGGPSLATFGISTYLPDPKLSVIALANGSTISTNNDWGGDATLANAFAQVGAFAYSASNSKDAGVYLPNLAPGNYTVQISDTGTGAGSVIAELYDATPASALSATTPRLVNVSVLKQIPATAPLTAGFVVGGTTAKTVVIRAVGPGLSAFGVTGTLADPTLKLFQTGAASPIASNDDWNGDTELKNAFTSVGAFALGATSKDAALLVTLPPGSYTAQVSGVNNTTGTALVEVYEVP